ncbi:MAG: polyribonucleotide nucleotidyltransferase [Deltaproteobacteria bacterium RIFCSPLOWO2_02_FULL_46_8]|nr:MAG: polyribonucleotide nucleotidyltransferase [Deltaproteobacteria bacterium RIFCSPLOWO2_02_FULL_46_8]
MDHSVKAEFGGRTLTLSTGELAKQAGGSVVVRYGDTIVLVTATVSETPKENVDFLPLTVDYVEKTFAAGKIPGGFFKREGRPTEMATLTSRFIDRPIRPLFPENYHNETQVIATVLSADLDNEPDILAMIGASSALMLSPAPFLGPIAGICVGRVDGKFVVNPTPRQMEESDMDIIVAGSKEAVVMVEGGANEIPEADMIAAIRFAHESIQPVLLIQEELAKKAGKQKMEVPSADVDSALVQKVNDFIGNQIKQAISITAKQERNSTIRNLKTTLLASVCPLGEEDTNYKIVQKLFEDTLYKIFRNKILSEGRRVDGRTTKDIRNISCKAGLLPRTHGSALFTRGETQALCVTTLGSSDDEQLIDALGEVYYKRFMLHYNFPPFSTGEVKFLRSPGRREIGHGALAERALSKVLPSQEDFPYTVRVVSEILESNGSSSMASVCGGILSLMDAGVPIKAPVAGIAMGLIKEGDRYAILSDILGDEDHLGDMDFKVAGTKKGVTALQMDIKITGLSDKLLEEALTQAHEGRLFILGEMDKVLSKPREALSPHAPKITTIKIPVDKIGALIGPGGKNIRSIVDETGAKVNVEDDGTVSIFAVDQESGERALKRVKEVSAVAEVGKYYRGTVVKIMEFGAFVEFMPNQDGLVHISQLENHRVKAVTDVVKEGDEIVVKVLEVDPNSGKVRLSRKDAVGHENEVIN